MARPAPYGLVVIAGSAGAIGPLRDILAVQEEATAEHRHATGSDRERRGRSSVAGRADRTIPRRARPSADALLEGAGVTGRGRWSFGFEVALPALVIAGCSRRPGPANAAPIQVEGRANDRRVLEGSWSGEFRNDRTGRAGTISFTLPPGQDTAYARVVLPGAAPAPGCGDALSQATSDDGSAELLLQLTWLGVEAGRVGGWLAPYHDPEAGCVMDIWFEGSAWKNRIEGSYFARPTDGSPLRIGSWEVRRAR